MYTLLLLTVLLCYYWQCYCVIITACLWFIAMLRTCASISLHSFISFHSFIMYHVSCAYPVPMNNKLWFTGRVILNLSICQSGWCVSLYNITCLCVCIPGWFARPTSTETSHDAGSRRHLREFLDEMRPENIRDHLRYTILEPCSSTTYLGHS